MKKYYNILHNAGLSNEEYRAITPNFMQENVKNLSMYSLMLALFFLVLSFVSIFGPGFVTTNSGLYLIIGSVMLLITICTRILLKKKNYPVSLVCILIYLFIIALYVEATYVTILHPESPSVTFIGLLLVIPAFVLAILLSRRCYIPLFSVSA